MKILPPMSGWAALFQAKALLAKAAALRRLLLLPAKVVLRLLASTVLREARLATAHHWVARVWLIATAA